MPSANPLGGGLGVRQTQLAGCAVHSARPCLPAPARLTHAHKPRSCKGVSGLNETCSARRTPSSWPCLTLPAHRQVPDYTVPLSSEVEAQAFLEASVADLPKAPKARTYEERHAPIGKVLLFTNKGSVPGVYRALALQFVGTSRLLFAWVQVSETEGPGIPLMQKMNVSVPACRLWGVCV